MQKQSSCNKPGTGNCEKPGGMGKKPSNKQLRKMQEGLAKQMEEMKKKMEGFNKGEGKSGEGGEMSKEFAQMAAKQAAIRKEVEKMAQELNGDGSGNGNKLNDIAKEMEETERDLVNKQLTMESLKRQQDIVTRLLQSRKSGARKRQRQPAKKQRSDQSSRKHTYAVRGLPETQGQGNRVTSHPAASVETLLQRKSQRIF